MEISFGRNDYLQYSEIFEAGTLDDVTNELSEFNEDVEDMAYELAYTRYSLAKAERRLAELQEAVRWGRECDEFDTWSDHVCMPFAYEWEEIIYAARAAVDALVGEG